MEISSPKLIIPPTLIDTENTPLFNLVMHSQPVEANVDSMFHSSLLPPFLMMDLAPPRELNPLALQVITLSFMYSFFFSVNRVVYPYPRAKRTSGPSAPYPSNPSAYIQQYPMCCTCKYRTELISNWGRSCSVSMCFFLEFIYVIFSSRCMLQKR